MIFGLEACFHQPCGQRERDAQRLPGGLFDGHATRSRAARAASDFPVDARRENNTHLFAHAHYLLCKGMCCAHRALLLFEGVAMTPWQAAEKRSPIRACTTIVSIGFPGWSKVDQAVGKISSRLVCEIARTRAEQ
ncbi:MAG: hypothetical protein ACTIJY_00320 [Luteimonas sp.]